MIFFCLFKVDAFYKQPFRGVLLKRCSENMQQTYRRTPMSKCDLNKVAKQLWSEVGIVVKTRLLFKQLVSSTILDEKSSFKMLGLSFSSKLDWGSYIVSIARLSSKRIRVLNCSTKFLSYIYKYTIRPCMKYCYHLGWAAGTFM